MTSWKHIEPLLVHKDNKPAYSIYFEPSFEQLPAAMEPLDTANRKICIVTDTNVDRLYADAVAELLKPYAAKIIKHIVPAGEAYKTLDSVKDIYEHLIVEKFERKDLLLALGGGVIGDMTGYTAATYLRGIDFIQVPTTLLSQVDSSVGGKTGVDFDSYKNMVGAFYQPKLVYMNLSVLETLPAAQFASGMAEVVKHGFIKSADYHVWLKAHREAILEKDIPTLAEMVRGSCNIKRLVVENDPTEKGERALLNFGHTLGHSVEKLRNFEQLHGECVAIGMAAASWLSWKRGLLSAEFQKEVEETIVFFDLPLKVEGLCKEDILAVSKSDKKMQAGQIRFVLLKEIGCAVVDDTITDDELSEAIMYITGGQSDIEK